MWECGTVNTVKTAVYEELARVAADCAEPDWNGYGAAPVSGASRDLARAFLEVLPADALPTSVGAEPDGQVTLEWYESPRRVLSISFDPKGVLHYAALLEGEERQGTERFEGRVPRKIAEIIGAIGASKPAGEDTDPHRRARTCTDDT